MPSISSLAYLFYLKAHWEQFKYPQKRFIRLGFDDEGLTRIGVNELQRLCMQQQAAAVELLAKEPVVFAAAVFGVADDGVHDVLHMSAQLMLAPGMRREPQQRIACDGVAADGVGQFRRGEPDIVGDGFLCRLVGAGFFVGHFVELLFEGIVDTPLRVGISAYDGEISLGGFARSDQTAHTLRRFLGEREQQYARCRFVQTVQRVDVPADLLTQYLDRERRLVSVDHGTVHQQSGGFVDGDEVFVAVEDLKHGATIARRRFVLVSLHYQFEGQPVGETIARNKKAYHDYEILETFEAGLVLKGSEVKAIRAGRVNLKDSFVKIVRGEAFLFNAHIGRLETTHRYYGHEERGSRKLLLHKKEIAKLAAAVEKDGHTIVPLQMYFNRKNIVKIQIAVARGKKLHDKRADMKEKDMKRDIARAMKEY